MILNDPKVQKILDEVKDREFSGYSYDGADASFELLATDFRKSSRIFKSLKVMMSMFLNREKIQTKAKVVFLIDG